MKVATDNGVFEYQLSDKVQCLFDDLKVSHLEWCNKSLDPTKTFEAYCPNDRTTMILKSNDQSMAQYYSRLYQSLEACDHV